MEEDVRLFKEHVKYWVRENGSKDSMRCGWRRILNRVRYWQFITTAEIDKIGTNCAAALDQLKADRASLMSGTAEWEGETFVEKPESGAGIWCH